MKKKLSLLFTLLFFVGVIAGQKVQPIQIQTIDTATYVVEYIPLPTAQANVNKQIEATKKQIAKVDAEIAKLVKQRDQLINQHAALELIAKQLDQAATTPPPPTTQSATPPATTEKPKTTKKKKN